MPSTAPGTPGTEGQACRTDGTCDAPLSCYSNLCVNATGAGTGGSGGTDASGSGGTDATSSGGTASDGSGGMDPAGEAGSDGTGATGAGGDTGSGVGGAGNSGDLDCRTEDSYIICGNAGLDWEDAQAYCVSQGGALVKIDNSAENSEIAELVSQEGSTWIGANDRDTEGDFRWTDGSEVTGENAHWQGGQPNDSGEEGEDCTVLHSGAGDWNDVDCSLTGFDDSHDMTFVCELPN